MTSNRQGFTLVELLVVVSMIAILAGVFSAAVTGAQERARIERATGEVKSVTQAILGYENHARNHELPVMERREADSSSLGFLLGNAGTSDSGQQIPVLLQASLTGGGKFLDPWGTPYRVTIRKGKLPSTTGLGSLSTGYQLPNFYRLSEGERR